MTELRYDMAQYYRMKAALEQLLGRSAYHKLKETGTLADWKAESCRLLGAIRVATSETVKVTDRAWQEEVSFNLAGGEKSIRASKSIDELFSALAATLAYQCFLQLGMIPYRSRVSRVSLQPKYWNLSGFRSVQYVQTPQQRETYERFLARNKGAQTT